MSPPEVPQVIELTSTVRFLLAIAGTVFTALIVAMGWLIVRLWKIARAFERKTWLLSRIPNLVRVVFGSGDQEENPRPGLVRRVGDLEKHADEIDELLGLDDVQAKRARIAQKLGLAASDVDAGGNTFSGVRDQMTGRRVESTGSHHAIAVPELEPPDSDE